MPEIEAAPTMQTYALAQHTPLPMSEPGESETHVCNRVIHVYSSIVEEPQELEAFNEYIHLLQARDEGLLVVHGSEVYLQEWQGRLHFNHAGKQPPCPLDLASMVLCGLVNIRLVASLNTRLVPAVGVSGVDLGVMQADFLNKELLGRIGGPPQIAAGYIAEMVDQGRVPVMAPIGLGPDGLPILIRAPLVAQMFAVELGADILDFVTAETFREVGTSVLTKSSTRSIGSMIGQKHFDGHLIPKLHASMAALSSGVEEVRFGNVEEKLASV